MHRNFWSFLRNLAFKKIWRSKLFGLNGRIIIGLAVALVMTICLITLVLEKFYFASFLILILLLPLVVGFIGIYYNNMDLLLGGLIAFFVILLICNILIKWYEKNDYVNIDLSKYKNE